jgi:hypothetical protein
MLPRILNVSLVESLQRAAERGRPVDVLHEIKLTTLAGLLEYGCLRQSYPDRFPECPAAVCSTPLGIALLQVPSPLGLRQQGKQQPDVRTVDTRTAEFRLLPPLDAFDHDVQWDNFLTRFERSARGVGFSANVSAKLQSAFAEMCENAVLHARSPTTPLAGYLISEATAQFTVVDLGIGVRASLGQNPLHSDLENDVDAIERALQTGVTCRPLGDGGFGFQSVFKALAEQWGQLRFRSGNGCISMDGMGLEADRSLRSRPLPLPGFQVSVCCRADGNPPADLPF